jgi:hypothetical protein
MLDLAILYCLVWVSRGWRELWYRCICTPHRNHHRLQFKKNLIQNCKHQALNRTAILIWKIRWNTKDCSTRTVKKIVQDNLRHTSEIIKFTVNCSILIWLFWRHIVRLAEDPMTKTKGLTKDFVVVLWLVKFTAVNLYIFPQSLTMVSWPATGKVKVCTNIITRNVLCHAEDLWQEKEITWPIPWHAVCSCRRPWWWPAADK